MNGRPSRTHRELIVWQKALSLAVEVHQATEEFPKAERFGLVAQLRRAAVSVPSNIAEGSARRTTRDFLAFLHVARGSLTEVETQLLIAQRVGYLPENGYRTLESLCGEVGRLLTAVIAALRARIKEQVRRE
jgi:four helix bundle protein